MELDNLFEPCESCGKKINHFKVIDVENEPYIICQPCFDHREKLNKMLEQFVIDHPDIAAQVEAEEREYQRNKKKKNNKNITVDSDSD